MGEQTNRMSRPAAVAMSPSGVMVSPLLEETGWPSWVRTRHSYIFSSRMRFAMRRASKAELKAISEKSATSRKPILRNCAMGTSSGMVAPI